VGDFIVEDRFMVERKTLPDFAASVIDARLFRQASALVQGAGRGILILEGTSANLGDVKVSRESLQGALIAVSVFYGLAGLRAKDAAETARLLVFVAGQAQRFARGALSRPGSRPKGKRARQLFVLQGLPGIGPARAARLLDRFGSIQGVTTASVDDLAAVDGIGESTATRLRWVLEETSPAGEV
jgi:DNA excision repair protein ERCC-4